VIEIAFARTDEEEKAIERALEDASIAFTFSLDAVEAAEGSACSLSRVYAVPEEDAERAREALMRHAPRNLIGA
jgi:hypothetical protein